MKFFFALSMAVALSFTSGRAFVSAQDTPDFGTPPSGAVPILFNDRHVYSRPDRVRANRLLSALVRGREILVPLRSVFEQMGAVVSYDSSTRMVTIAGRGTKAQLTVGIPQIVLNGTVRPLDVPPEINAGEVLVPVRVLVESLGGYVQYLPSLRAVSIRYVPTSVVGPAAATPVALARTAPVSVDAPAQPSVRATVPPGAPIPVGTPEPETFLLVDTLVAPKIANAQAPVVTGASGTSFSASAVSEFTIVDVNFDIGAHFQEYRYAHPTGPITRPGGSPVSFQPAFVTIDRDYDAHLGVQLSPSKYYVDVDYAVEQLGGYPRVSGIGLGLEKLPNLNRRLDFAFDTVYSPNMSGRCTTCPGSPLLAFRRFAYGVGLTYSLPPIFLEAGYRGDVGKSKGASSDDFTHSGVAAGLGLRF